MILNFWQIINMTDIPVLTPEGALKGQDFTQIK
jgi:hypothetical protein